MEVFGQQIKKIQKRKRLYSGEARAAGRSHNAGGLKVGTRKYARR